MGLAAALSFGPMLAGCGADVAPPPEAKVLLQSAAVRGPDPYTASSVRDLATPAPQPPAPTGGSGAGPLRGQILRTVSGATPGLYGGVDSVGSCDPERQISLLDADPARARAFAGGAGISRAGLPGFVRGLTPVVLRADTRITSHGYRADAAVARQAVLQAGTAVLVDPHGTPRVRCAGGNPLTPPVAAKGSVLHQGRPWSGYQSERTVVVRPAARAVDSLVIADVADSGWIDRRTGSDGEEDIRPDVLPPIAPDDIYTYPPTTSEPAGVGDAAASDEQGAPPPAPGRSPAPPEPSSPVPADPTPGDLAGEVVPSPADPGVLSDDEGAVPFDPDPLDLVDPPAGPDAFAG
ncbi:DUF6777 domain-containing protein [Streptomyces sp. NPDC020965]|uniref:DUF6777 domain-containing protein n=1 Tax=Streptomyces sp. NPDC020965 TaxID=3365105 RepID=UPI00378F5A80